jgi:hypothetical protein
MKFRIKLLACLVVSSALVGAHAADGPHNLILFVPDGMRAQMVRPDTAPAMAALRDAGVNFENSHSVFPTLTTANASTLATGHHLGDTGNFGNTIYAGVPIAAAGGSVTPFLENDAVLGEVDKHVSGNYLSEESLLVAARRAGFNTAAVGKLGPTLIFGHTDRSGQVTVIADDATGSADGIPLPPWLVAGLAASGLPTVAPSRGENGKSGTSTAAGTLSPNIAQQQWFVSLFTNVVLRKFKEDGKPFVAVFWSRDPDGSQHNQGDSLNQLVPGINGPTALAGIRNADENLRQIREALTALGLEGSTDIVVSSDHGFSTISKHSASSGAAREHYPDVPTGFLPPGFLAKDLARALKLPLWDPDRQNKAITAGTHSRNASGVLGANPEKPRVVVAGNGGAGLVYLPTSGKRRVERKLAQDVVKALLAQDYVSGLFVDERLGRIPGTLTLKDINLHGGAAMPVPAIVVNFRSHSTGCAQPYTCGVDVSDSTLQQGQGMHGSFSRANTYNFTAAFGPDFKKQFVDHAPVSNADIGRTIAVILGLDIAPHGALLGRVLGEAMPGGEMPHVVKASIKSMPARNGLRTILNYQQVGSTRYLDAAGFPSRTLGLDASQ